MNTRPLKTAAFLTLGAIVPFRADAGTLRGSPGSMKHQHEIAVDEDLTFTKKPSQVEKLADNGTLVRVEQNADFAMSNVSYPYVRPEVLLFIQRLSAQFRADNGAKLVVTSLTRPEDLQPRNAHKLSVHPAGMAVDFRVPATSKQRAWLEKALLGLENAGLLDVTREKHPPHYHVAVFPAEYLAYAEKRIAREPAVVANAPDPATTSVRAAALTADVAASGPGGPAELVAATFLAALLGTLIAYPKLQLTRR